MKIIKGILKYCSLIITCLFVTATLAFSGTQTTNLVNKHNLKIGPDIRDFHYEEDGLMEIDGLMYGVAGEYTYHGISDGTNNLMAKLRLEYLKGDMDYDGQTGGGTPLSEDTEDFIIQTRALLGPDFLLNQNLLLTPYAGLSYRYWNDEIGGAGGYERKIKQWYAPIGANTLVSLTGKWTCEITAEYDLFLGGKVKSYLSDVNPTYPNPEVDQEFDDGYGLRFSACFKREIANNYAFSIEPYIRYWDIDKSEEERVTYGGNLYKVWEPENETTCYGVRISFIF